MAEVGKLRTMLILFFAIIILIFFVVSFVCVCLFLCFVVVVAVFLAGYSLEFPEKGVNDYMQLWGLPNMKSFTVCFWVKTSQHYGTPFSYAVSSSANNELLIETPGSFKMIIGHNQAV